MCLIWVIRVEKYVIEYAHTDEYDGKAGAVRHSAARLRQCIRSPAVAMEAVRLPEITS